MAGFRITKRKTFGGVCERAFRKGNRARKTHSECGHTHPLGSGLGLNTKEKLVLRVKCSFWRLPGLTQVKGRHCAPIFSDFPYWQRILPQALANMLNRRNQSGVQEIPALESCPAMEQAASVDLSLVSSPHVMEGGN